MPRASGRPAAVWRVAGKPAGDLRVERVPDEEDLYTVRGTIALQFFVLLFGKPTLTLSLDEFVCSFSYLGRGMDRPRYRPRAF